jgi:hypothetical protein
MTGILKRKFTMGAGLLALLGALVCPTVRADGTGLGDLTITLPTISGIVGQQVIVGGTLMNSSTNTLYFANESLNFTSLTVPLQQTDVVTNAFFGGGPGSIDGGSTLPVTDLFRFTIPDVPAGSYDLNSYDLLGGTDPNCAIGTGVCDVLLGTVSFTVNVQGTVRTPEPGTLLLLASGLLAGLLVIRHAA